MSGYVYMEEYKTCSCTQIERRKSDLQGYCHRHGTSKKRIVKLPDDNLEESDLGFVET